MIEIRCRPLSTASTEATCTNNDEWVSCEAPVLPRTKALVSCRNSYRRETTFLSRDEVRCNANGQWEPQPIRCVPGPLTINIYLNDTNLSLQSFLNANNATLIEILEDKVIVHINSQNISINIMKSNRNLISELNSNLTKDPWIWP